MKGKFVLRVIVTLVFIGTTLSCAFARSQRIEFEELFNLKHFVYGEDKAIYQRIVKEKEDKIIKSMLEFLYKDVLSYYRRNRFNEAMMLAKEILLIDPNYKKASFFMEGLKDIIKQGGTSKARREVVERYYQKGLDFYTEGDLIKAVKFWQKALVLSPRYGGYKDCKILIKKAKQHLTELYYQEGLNFYKKRKYELALEKWYIVAEVAPGYGNVLELIQVAKKEVYRQKINSLYNKGLSLYETGKKEKALSVFKKLLALAPRHKKGIAKKNEIERNLANHYFNIGKTHFGKKNFKTAIKHFKKALQFSPQSSRILSYLSKAREQQALLAIKPKPKPKPKPEKVSLPPVKKPSPPVEPEIQRLTQEQIEQAENLYITGLYYYQNGFLEEAISEWEKVVAINPRHEKARTSLKKAKLELRRLRR